MSHEYYSHLIQKMRDKTVRKIGRLVHDTDETYAYTENDKITLVVNNKQIIDHGMVVYTDKKDLPPRLRSLVDMYGALTKLLIDDFG
jgi:hypothetical protein